MSEATLSEMGIPDAEVSGQKSEGRMTRVKTLGTRISKRAAIAVTSAAMVGAMGAGSSKAEAAQMDRPAGVTQMEEQEKQDDINEFINGKQQELAKDIDYLYIQRSSTEDLSRFDGNAINLTLNIKSDAQLDGRYTQYEISTNMGITSDRESDSHDTNKVESVNITASDMSSNPDDARTVYSMTAIKDNAKWITNATYGEKSFGLSSAGTDNPKIEEYEAHFKKMKEALQHAEKADYMEPIAPPEDVPQRPAMH